MSKQDELENDYERMVPEFHKNTLIYAEHVTRYISAQELVKGKIVLDIASGSGYGTKMLAQKAKHVYGVDINERAVNYSEKNFGAKNIEYLLGDGISIPLADNSVDVVVTFETIEHIKDYKKFIQELKRVLKPDGLAIVSTPNELEFAEGNHFHLHEFEYQELFDLLKKDFANIDPYFQSTWKYVAIDTPEKLEKEGNYNTDIINFNGKKRNEHLYFYLLCSNRRINEKITPVAALGEHYSDRQLNAKESQYLEDIKNKQVYIESLISEVNHHKELFKNEHKSREQLERHIQVIQSSKGYKVYNLLKRVKNKLLH